MAEIKQIQIPGITAPYEINAKYIQDGSGNAKAWSDITSLISAQTDLVPLDTLPTANTATYNTYKNDIILIPAETSETGNERDEYMIFKGGTSSTPTYHWEKIGTTAADLATKADKGTYTTSQAGSGNTGQGGAQTANGTATVTYKKSAEATGSAGGHNHTVTAPKSAFVTGVKATGGTADVLTGVTSDGTASVVKTAIKSASIAASTTATAGPTYVQSVTHTAASLGTADTGTVTISGGSYSGTTKYMKVTATAAGDTEKGTVGFTKAALGTASTVNAVTGVAADGSDTAIKTLGTGTFVTGASVSAAGVLSFPTASAYNSVSASFTALKGVKASGTTPVVTGYPNFSGGALTGTTKFVTTALKSVSLTASTTSTDGPAYTESISGSAPSLGGTKTFVTGYSSFSGGSITPVTRYLALTTVAADDKATVLTGVKGNGTATVILSTGLDTANAVTSVSLADAAGHTHSITLTDTAITGTAAVAVSNHTHSIGNHTHSVTI